MRNSREAKLDSVRTENRVYCKCGHAVTIYPFEKVNKKICSWCGNYVYKDEKERFKDILSKKIKAKEGCVK